MEKYRCGLDVSSVGFFCLLEGNKIVDICQVPQKIEDKELSKVLTNLKKDAKIKGNKTRCEKEIKLINNKILNQPRDCKRVFEWLSQYKDEIEVVNIEKPIMQSMSPTSIQSLCKMQEYIGIITCMLDILGIPYNIISINDWRSNFKYNKLPKEEVQRIILESGGKKKKTEISRAFAKLESIRISEEEIENIRDWYVLPRCKNISSDIAESALLGII